MNTKLCITPLDIYKLQSEKNNCKQYKGVISMNKCLSLIYTFILFSLSCCVSISHPMWSLKKGTKGGLDSREQKNRVSEQLTVNRCYHDCQNSSKLLLYSDRSWISRFATCQLISCDCKILQSTSPAGKIHHSLSSLLPKPAISGKHELVRVCANCE